MKLTHSVIDQLVIVSIIGEMVGNDVLSFKTDIMALMEHEDCQAILINLKQMTIIDSYGFGSIVSFYKEASEKQIIFAICHLDKSTSEFFEYLEDPTLAIYDTETDAIEYIEEELKQH